MHIEENQSKSISDLLLKTKKVASNEAIDIAARIMANRAKRELELNQQKNPNQKDDCEKA